MVLVTDVTIKEIDDGFDLYSDYDKSDPNTLVVSHILEHKSGVVHRIGAETGKAYITTEVAETSGLSQLQEQIDTQDRHIERITGALEASEDTVISLRENLNKYEDASWWERFKYLFNGEL